MPLRPKPCLRQWYSSNLPVEWLESQSWESTESIFFQCKGQVFPNFRCSTGRNIGEKIQGTVEKWWKMHLLEFAGCFGGMIHSVFVTSPILGSNKATSKWGNRPGGQHVCEHGSRLPCVHTLRIIFRFYFSCAWSEVFGTLQWPPSRFGESCQDATWAAAASKLQLSAMASSLLLLAAARATERGPSCWSHRPQLPLLRHWSAEEPSSNRRTIFTHAFELCLQATWTLNAIFSELLLEFKALAVSLTCFALLPANPHFGPSLEDS